MRRAALLLVALMGCSSSDELTRSVADDQLSAWVAGHADVQEMRTTIGEPVPVRQGGIHSDTWWDEFTRRTNGQDRTRMLYIESEGDARPQLVDQLAEEQLALTHGHIRHPVRHGLTWWLLTPTSALRQDLRRQGDGYDLLLCTQRDTYGGVVAITADGARRARVEYITQRVAEPTAYATRLNRVREAVSCTPSGDRKSQIARFTREDEEWVLDGSREEQKGRRRR